MAIYKVDGKRCVTWYADVRADGHRIRKAVGNKKDAEKAEATIKADILRGVYKFKRERKILFKDFAEEYIEKYSKLNKRSWQRDEYSLDNLLPYFGKMLLSKIDSKDIDSYRKKRLEEVIKRPWRKKEYKVKPSTINREISLMRHMLNVAIRWKYIDKNPAKGTKMFQERKLEMRILTVEEINRLIDCASDHLKPIVIVAINCGLRKNEILSLKWNDIEMISISFWCLSLILHNFP